MAKSPTLTDITSAYGSRASINENNTKLVEAFENTISRDGSSPNEMEADLDLNSNSLLNIDTINAKSIRLNGELLSVDSSSSTGTIETAYQFKDVHAFLTSTNTTFVAGDVVTAEKEGYSYTALDASEATFHVQNAGGAKFFVNTKDSAWPIEAFGATGSGDETAIFVKIVESLPAEGGTILLEAENYTVDVSQVNRGSKEVLWVGPSTINTQVYRALPGSHEAFNKANNREIYYEHDPAPNSFVKHDFYKNANYTGGTTGVTSILRTYSKVADTAGTPGEITSEWPFQSRVDNYSDNVNGVAVTGQVRRYANGPNWSLHGNSLDYTDPSVVTKNTWGAEINIQGEMVDVNNRRIVCGVIAHNLNLTYSPGDDSIGSGVYVYPHTADYEVGIRIGQLSGAGTTSGVYKQSALLIDATAPNLINARNPSGTGVCRYGTEQNTGVIHQNLSVGNNDINQAHTYVDMRSEIDDNTDGAEDGRWRVYVSEAGTLREFIRINTGAANQLSLRVAGVLKEVKEGAPDSGGVGLRALVVNN